MQMSDPIQHLLPACRAESRAADGRPDDSNQDHRYPDQDDLRVRTVEQHHRLCGRSTAELRQLVTIVTQYSSTRTGEQASAAPAVIHIFVHDRELKEQLSAPDARRTQA